MYSLDVIGQSYDDGDLTEEEYLLLAAQAMFDHESLPEEYHAEFATGVHATSLLWHIDRAFDTLSAEAQEQLRPYILSCDDPDSYWHDPDQPRIADLMPESLECDCTREMLRPLVDGSYFGVTGGTEAQQELVNDALEYAYGRYRDLGFNEPTDWVRVTIQDTFSDPTTLGEAWMATLSGHRRCHIALLSSLEDDRLRSTAAHEMFHCFQRYVELEEPIDHYWWVTESTAVWAEDFVYPDINREHEYDDQFFSTLSAYFFDSEGTMEYARYFYWIYLDQQTGDTGEVVRDMYLDIYANGTEETVLGRDSSQEEFKEYALWNPEHAAA